MSVPKGIRLDDEVKARRLGAGRGAIRGLVAGRHHEADLGNAGVGVDCTGAGVREIRSSRLVLLVE